jgi:hypothetical protein
MLTRKTEKQYGTTIIIAKDVEAWMLMDKELKHIR